MLFWMQGGCSDFCNMGTHNTIVPGVLGSFFIFSAYAVGIYFSMHYDVVASMHESYKASEIG